MINSRRGLCVDGLRSTAAGMIFFGALAAGPEELTRDPEPIGRYNVTPGTKILLLCEGDGDLAFDPVYWGYGPEWWDKAPLINARGKTAASGRMFKPL